MKITTVYTIIIGLVSFALCSFTPIQDITTIPVDVSKSKVEWKARKIAGKHNGYISIASGTVETDGKIITGGQFVIDTKTMTDVDVRFKPANHWLMKHLKNNFFEVNKYPEAKFIITSVTPNADIYMIVGKMTIKDSTQEIRFPAIISTTLTTVNAEATIKLDRRKFGIDYGSGLLKRMANRAIYHDFELKIKLTAGN